MSPKLPESTARLREKLARSSVARESMGRWAVPAEGNMGKMTGRTEDKWRVRGRNGRGGPGEACFGDLLSWVKR